MNDRPKMGVAAQKWAWLGIFCARFARITFISNFVPAFFSVNLATMIIITDIDINKQTVSIS
jgi:hypothetical protein